MRKTDIDADRGLFMMFSQYRTDPHRDQILRQSLVSFLNHYSQPCEINSMDWRLRVKTGNTIAVSMCTVMNILEVSEKIFKDFICVQGLLQVSINGNRTTICHFDTTKGLILNTDQSVVNEYKQLLTYM